MTPPGQQQVADRGPEERGVGLERARVDDPRVLEQVDSASSETPTIAEFLTIAMISDPIGEITVRNACGRMIRRSVSP